MLQSSRKSEMLLYMCSIKKYAIITQQLTSGVNTVLSTSAFIRDIQAVTLIYLEDSLDSQVGIAIWQKHDHDI